jgi:hypothetical protein
MNLPRLPNKCSVLEAKYSAEQMREYATKAVEEFRDHLAKEINAMPFGDTSASFAVWIKEQK